MAKTKEERAAYKKAWYSTNKDTIRERQKAHYLANREHIRASQNAHQAAHKDNEEHKARRRESQRKYELAHREKLQEKQRAYDATFAGDKAHRERGWLSQGIAAAFTVEEYNGLCDQQGHACLLCKDGNSQSGKPHALSVDHDHATGKVRGLLCHACNRTLGKIDKHGLTGPHRCGAAFTSRAFVYLLTASLQNGCPQYRSQNITQSTI